MARQGQGAVIEHTGRDGRVYRSLRFTAYGKRRFVSLGPITRAEAEKALRYALTDIERGTWLPPQDVAAPAEPERAPTFHEYAERWWKRNSDQLRDSTQDDYKWRLQVHLLPFFAEYRLDEITFDVVERYLAEKLAEARRKVDAIALASAVDDVERRERELREARALPGLSPRSINMTVTLLGAILERARKSGLIGHNPVKGDSDLRVREHAPRRTYLRTAGEITALLDAAGEKDTDAREDRQHVHRRAMLAVLVFAGLRIGELCALRWRDVDLAAGWLTVGEAKTDAGRRRVKIRGALRDELAGVRAQAATLDPDAFVFATSTGRKPGSENVRNRVLRPAVELASERLVARGLAPLSEGLTPHSLRRTFASVLYALRTSPRGVMREMGHNSPTLALAIYAQVMDEDDEREMEALRSLVEGGELAFGGRRGGFSASAATVGEAA